MLNRMGNGYRQECGRKIRTGGFFIVLAVAGLAAGGGYIPVVGDALLTVGLYADQGNWLMGKARPMYLTMPCITAWILIAVALIALLAARVYASTEDEDMAQMRADIAERERRERQVAEKEAHAQQAQQLSTPYAPPQNPLGVGWPPAGGGGNPFQG